jgi:hypothetical protein
MALRAVIAAFVALGISAPAAAADSLSIATKPASPQDSTPVQIKVSGNTASQQPYVNVYWQRRPGDGCPADPSTAGGETFFTIDGGPVSPGDYSFTSNDAFPAGQTLICGYLLENDENTGETHVLALGSKSFTVQPVDAHLSISAPAQVGVDQHFDWKVKFTLPDNADARLFVTVKPAAEAGCAKTPFDEPRDATYIVQGQSIAGTDSYPLSGHFAGKGTNLFCAWIEQTGNVGVLAGPVSHKIVVGALKGGRIYKGNHGVGFRKIGSQLFNFHWKLTYRCGAKKKVRKDSLGSITLSGPNAFIVDFTGGSGAHGRLKGSVHGKTAKGTLKETFKAANGTTCRSGKVSWKARRR